MSDLAAELPTKQYLTCRFYVCILQPSVPLLCKYPRDGEFIERHHLR